MEAARTSETLVNFYQTTRRYNPDDSHLCTHRRENLKSYLALQQCFLYSAFTTITTTTTPTPTIHTADDSLTALERVFGDRIISRGLWPVRSPGLTPCGFYLWGNLKDKVHRTNPKPNKSFRKTSGEKFWKLLRNNFFR
jgi:hypothetical protein